jgi:hypothetical protein
MDHHGGRSPKSGEAAREAFRALAYALTLPPKKR